MHKFYLRLFEAVDWWVVGRGMGGVEHDGPVSWARPCVYMKLAFSPHGFSSFLPSPKTFIAGWLTSLNCLKCVRLCPVLSWHPYPGSPPPYTLIPLGWTPGFLWRISATDNGFIDGWMEGWMDHMTCPLYKQTQDSRRYTLGCCFTKELNTFWPIRTEDSTQRRTIKESISHPSLLTCYNKCERTFTSYCRWKVDERERRLFQPLSFVMTKPLSPRISV